MDAGADPEVVIGTQISNEKARELFVAGTLKEVTGRYEAIAGLMALAANAGYREFGYSSLEQFVRVEAGLSQRDLRDRLRVGRKLIEVPELDRAFRAGALSWSKVRALVPVIHGDNFRAWITRAMRVSVNDLQHIVGGSREPIVSERLVPMFPVSLDTWRTFQRLARILRVHPGSRELSDEECMRRILELARGLLAPAEQTGTNGSPSRSRHIPARVRDQVRARARNRCENEGCDNLLSPQMHHADVPFSEGGEHTPENIEQWCKRCHDFVHHTDQGSDQDRIGA
jgi:hypothetical protein